METLTRRLRTLPDRHGRVTLILLAIILALGFGLRAYRVVEPLPAPGDDSRAYYALAKSLYEEGSFGGRNFDDASDWSPGAPLVFAAAFYATGGAREGTARIVELIFGLAAIVVAYLLGRRLNCRPAGLIAAFGVAAYPPFIHSTGALFSEPIALFTLPAAVLAFLWVAGIGRRDAADGSCPGEDPSSSQAAGEAPSPGHPSEESPSGTGAQAVAAAAGREAASGAGRSDASGAWWLLPGLLFGASAMVRPEYLVVGVAFVALALAWGWLERGWRPGLAAAVLLGVGLVLPILPWAVRNQIVLDRTVPISTGGGKALFTGTLLPADGEYQRVKALLLERQRGIELEPGSDALDRIDPAPLFDRVAAESYPDLPRDEALGKVGKENLYDYLGEDPTGYAAMTARKVWRMWSSGIGEAMSSTAGRAIQVAIVLAAIGGAFALGMRRRWWELVVVATPIALVTAVGAATLAAPRRNEVLMTLIFPLAGVALARLGAAGRISSSPRWRAPRASSRPS